MRLLISSAVGFANQMDVNTSLAKLGPRVARRLLAVFFADAPVRFAKWNALAGDQRVGFLGGVNRGVEFDRLGPETHALDSYCHDGRSAQREVDAAEQRRLDELQ